MRERERWIGKRRTLPLDLDLDHPSLSLSSPSLFDNRAGFKIQNDHFTKEENKEQRTKPTSHGLSAVGELSNPAVNSAAAVAAASQVRPRYLSATIRSRSLLRSASIWALEGVVGALAARTGGGVEEEGGAGAGGGTIGASTGGVVAPPGPLPPPPPPSPPPSPSTAFRTSVASSSTSPTPRAPKITTGSVRSEGAARDSGKTRRRRASTAPPTSTMELPPGGVAPAIPSAAADDARWSASCAPGGTLLGMFSTMRGM